MKSFALLGALSGAVAVGDKPNITDKAGSARWVMNQVNWGVIATTNIRLNGVAFGNPISVAQIDGQPFFYVSLLDESMKDIQKNPECTLSLSEASIDCISKNIDPEDPRCARLSLTGKMVNTTSDEHDKAKEVLFKQHPAMKSWPAAHDWLVTKLEIDKLWLINFFGGAADIAVKDYYAVPSSPSSPPASPAHQPIHKQPNFLLKAASARWLIHEVTWGSLATTSVHLNGEAFANPVSLVDGTEDNATGTPYFCISTLDASVQDIQKNPKFSLTVSQAEVDCALHGITGAWDPEDPRCTRLTYTGSMSNVTDAAEFAFAKKALIAKHPSMADWFKMGSHDFFIGRMNIEDIWLINMFGGASNIDLKDYYNAKADSEFFATAQEDIVV